MVNHAPGRSLAADLDSDMPYLSLCFQPNNNTIDMQLLIARNQAVLGSIRVEHEAARPAVSQMLLNRHTCL